MKRLHWLILKSFLGPFILIFFIVLFVLLMQFLWRYIDDLVGKGLEFKIIAELLLYTSSSLVPMALPLAILMSSLMTFGNMGEFYELTAIKASGISLQRLMKPLVILVVLISIGAFFFANEVLPFTNLKMRSLLYDVRNQRPEIQILPGSFYSGIDGYSVRVERKDPSTNMLYDVKIYDHTQNRGNTNVILADSGRMVVADDERSMIFTLYNGCSYNELQDDRKYHRKKTYPHRYDKFEEQQIIIELSGFALKRTDENLFRNHYAMLDLRQLGMMEDSIKSDITSKEDMLSKTLLHSNYFRLQEKSNSRRDNTPPEVRDLTQRQPAKNFKKLEEVRKLTKPKTESRYKNLPEVVKPGMPEMVYQKKTNKDSSIYLDLFNRLTLKEREIVLSSAQSYARSARTYVVSSVNTIDAKMRSLRRFQIEAQRKFTISFACFIFLFIGAPLGAIIRKGGLGLPLVLSALFFIFYYIISLMGEKFVRESMLPDYEGMWISSFLFFITGLFLTYKATTDAAMLNFETYSNLVKKYLGIRKRNLVEILGEKKLSDTKKPVKYEKLIASLNSFRDTLADTNEDVITRMKFSGYLLSLIGLRESSNIVLLERLYKNITLSIMSSNLMEDPDIRQKLEEFPNFSYQRYLDLRWRLFLRLILLLIPPVTLIVLIYHYLQLHWLQMKINSIDQFITDLVELLERKSILQS